ncbi:MAG: hypothetical protein HGA27_04765 [Peptococcaceae bacterium]|nr:hypothetical protein [Peptococcaceae bacterium]
MNCDACNSALTEDDDEYVYNGKKLCEDCYLQVIKGPKSCDHSVVESIVSKRLDK